MKPVLAEVQPDECPGPRTKSGGPHSLTPLKLDAVFLPSPCLAPSNTDLAGCGAWHGARGVHLPLPRFCSQHLQTPDNLTAVSIIPP